jgi:hypothetical protein
VIRNVQNLAINARDAMTGGGELNITEFLAARIPAGENCEPLIERFAGFFCANGADKKEVSAATRTPPAS